MQRRLKNEVWGKWVSTPEVLKIHPLNRHGEQFITAAYYNLVFSVQVSIEPTEWGEITHLWIRRHDGNPPVWREMQRIKDDLIGADRTGVEVYPTSEELVNAAPMYHLWVLPEGFKLPFSIGAIRRSDGN